MRGGTCPRRSRASATGGGGTACERERFMSDARAEILGRIRAALADVDRAGPPPEVPREYGRGGALETDALVELLSDRIRDYAAEAECVDAAEVGAAVRDACARLGIARLLVAPGVPAGWWPGGAEQDADRSVPEEDDGRSVPEVDDDRSVPEVDAGRVAAAAGDGSPTVEEDDGRPAAALDAVDGVLTGCALAIAETGTLVLDGRPPCGRRALTLVPDRHICVVSAEQIVERVPEAIGALRERVLAEGAPVTFVSGSSATSDIELERVEGVHGPRRLLVLVAG